MAARVRKLPSRFSGDDLATENDIRDALKSTKRKKGSVLSFVISYKLVLSEFFEAKGILRQKVFRDGSRRFLVEWRQADAAPSWEPEGNLSSALLQEWEHQAVARYAPLPHGNLSLTRLNFSHSKVRPSFH